MSTQQIKTINIIGISIRTTNEDQQAVKDIPTLWKRFISEEIAGKIPNKTDDIVYCVYTDYEKDHTKPYTTILGCQVEHLKDIPKGMVGKTLNAGNYELFTAKGNLTHGAVFNEWIKIWNADLQRTFTTDFEVYGVNAQNSENAEVDIFVAVK